jgi:hypothetical protein
MLKGVKSKQSQYQFNKSLTKVYFIYNTNSKKSNKELSKINE